MKRISIILITTIVINVLFILGMVILGLQNTLERALAISTLLFCLLYSLYWIDVYKTIRSFQRVQEQQEITRNTLFQMALSTPGIFMMGSLYYYCTGDGSYAGPFQTSEEAMAALDAAMAEIKGTPCSCHKDQ